MCAGVVDEVLVRSRRGGKGKLFRITKDRSVFRYCTSAVSMIPIMHASIQRHFRLLARQPS